MFSATESGRQAVRAWLLLTSWQAKVVFGDAQVALRMAAGKAFDRSSGAEARMQYVRQRPGETL